MSQSILTLWDKFIAEPPVEALCFDSYCFWPLWSVFILFYSSSLFFITRVVGFWLCFCLYCLNLM